MAVGDGKRGGGGGRPPVDSVAAAEFTAAINVVEQKGQQVGVFEGVPGLFITQEGKALQEGKRGYLKHSELLGVLAEHNISPVSAVTKAGLANAVKATSLKNAGNVLPIVHNVAGDRKVPPTVRNTAVLGGKTGEGATPLNTAATTSPTSLRERLAGGSNSVKNISQGTAFASDRLYNLAPHVIQALSKKEPQFISKWMNAEAHREIAAYSGQTGASFMGRGSFQNSNIPASSDYWHTLASNRARSYYSTDTGGFYPSTKTGHGKFSYIHRNDPYLRQTNVSNAISMHPEWDPGVKAFVDPQTRKIMGKPTGLNSSGYSPTVDTTSTGQTSLREQAYNKFLKNVNNIRRGAIAGGEGLNVSEGSSLASMVKEVAVTEKAIKSLGKEAAAAAKVEKQIVATMQQSGKANPLKWEASGAYAPWSAGMKRYWDTEAGAGGAGAGAKGGFLGQFAQQARHAIAWQLYTPLIAGAAGLAGKALGYGDYISKPQFGLIGVDFDESMRRTSAEWAMGQQRAFMRPQEHLTNIKEVASAWGEDVTPQNQAKVHHATKLTEMAAQYAMIPAGNVARVHGKLTNLAMDSKRYAGKDRGDVYKESLNVSSNVMKMGTTHLDQWFTAASYAIPQMYGRGDSMGDAYGEVSWGVERIGAKAGPAIGKIATGVELGKIARTNAVMEQFNKNVGKFGDTDAGRTRALELTHKEMSTKYFNSPEGFKRLSQEERNVKTQMDDLRGRQVTLINYAKYLDFFRGAGWFTKGRGEQMVDQQMMPYVSLFKDQDPDTVVKQIKEKGRSTDLEKKSVEWYSDTSPGAVKSRAENAMEPKWDKLRRGMGVPVWQGISRFLNDGDFRDEMSAAIASGDINRQADTMAAINFRAKYKDATPMSPREFHTIKKEVEQEKKEQQQQSKSISEADSDLLRATERLHYAEIVEASRNKKGDKLGAGPLWDVNAPDYAAKKALQDARYDHQVAKGKASSAGVGDWGSDQMPLVQPGAFGKEVSYQIAGGGIITEFGEAFGLYPKGTSKKQREEFMKNFPETKKDLDSFVEKNADETAGSGPSKERQSKFTQDYEAGKREPIIVNVYVGGVKTPSTSEVSDTNSKIGQDHGGKTFNWGRPSGGPVK